MYKRQHYALEHSARDSASSGSSSSLDTASDADSGDPEQGDEGEWPASSHESDEELKEGDVAEVQSSASVAERRAEAILVAERKLAEAAEDLGEFEDRADGDDDKSKKIEQSRAEAQSSDTEGSDESQGESDEDGRNGTVLKETRADSDSDDEEVLRLKNEVEELLAQRKVSNQWAEAVDEDDTERARDRLEDNTVISVGGESKVLKCRLCPKIICLNEETMQTHLASKRHARSLKQLAEGRLKIKLDSDGEEDEEGETHAERYARTLAAAQEVQEESKNTKRDSGRQRQRRREKAKKAKSQSENVTQNGIGQNRKEMRALLQTVSAGGDNAESVSGSKKGAKESGTEIKAEGKVNGEKRDRDEVKPKSKSGKRLIEGGSGGRAFSQKKRLKGGKRVHDEAEPKSKSVKKAKEGGGGGKAVEKNSANVGNGVSGEGKSKSKSGVTSSRPGVSNDATSKKKRPKLA
ncbi:hypothetical protein R1sor_022689 [Riccia sorocarpa]|uniref:Uncharacterized protein n=1 Tax=Riccia sorocarpa TaxID=122646 RepID=A0ABD3GLA1_9MARC